MNKFSIAFVFALLIPLSSAQAQWKLFGPNKKINLKCENLRDIKKGFLIAHINTSKMSPTLEAKTIKQYLDFLDPVKIYFSNQDVKNLTKKMKGVFKDINNGKCEKIHHVQKTYVQRVKDRVNYAKSRLNDKFKFNKKVRIVLDPDKRGFAKNSKHLKKLQEKYLHFQVSNRLITGKKLKESVGLVSRSYDRGLKKVEKIDQEEVLSQYLNAFAHSLDPHTSYFSADVLEDFEIQMSLSLEGIGATLTSEDGFTVVDSLVKGGAAERSGLIKTQDKIIAVGQFKQSRPEAFESVVEWDLRDVVRKIRGKKGSKVR